MIIDANVHYLPENLFHDKALLEGFMSSVPAQYGEFVKVVKMAGTDLNQMTIEKPKGYVNLNYAENQYNSAQQIKDMDNAGINKVVFRIPCWQEWLPLEICKKVNDLISATMKKYPGRCFGLAVVPPWGTSDSIKELERCIKELGFVGVQMAAHYGNLYLDEEEFRPYFKKLNELKIPVVVHHTPLPVDYKSVLTYTNQRRQYGRCIDQATAVGRELFSEMLDEFPNIKFIHSMLGGGFFAYANMLVPKVRPSDIKEEVAMHRFEASDKIRGYLEKNFYFDTSGPVQWGKDQLECAIKVFGKDHVLFGSSYPVKRDWFAEGIDYIKKLDITDDAKAKVLGLNAAKLFGI